ncbi:MAG: DNA (cytosine-5-)-methyltransferase [Bacteroidota bacterium]
MGQLRVCELFAGVGGFRLGLEQTGHYKVVWSNQWEPSTKTQHASQVYTARFGAESHSNIDIEHVPTKEIPDHDILVGGFPCQDYSVAASLKSLKGLEGKKGVLWWSIHRILSEKQNKPPFLLLENVDRLLKSPSKQRGRDFAIMLRSLINLDYAVEWRVINAADYGMPQRRRRVFLFAYHKSTSIFKQLLKSDKISWLDQQQGLMAQAFPVEEITAPPSSFFLGESLLRLSQHFNEGGKNSPFLNTGVCVEGHVFTTKVSSLYQGPKIRLRDVLEDIPEESDLFLPESEVTKWEYLKGAKKEQRTHKNGFTYHYSEGAMRFPDDLNQPSRTIITGEGGKAPSRFKHVVQTEKGLRRLSPLELERLNMFPDNHTKLEGISDAKRAFFMGNALVVGIVERLGLVLHQNIRKVEKQFYQRLSEGAEIVQTP